MLSVDWTEMLIIGVVMLIVIGPKELPETMRTIGHYVNKARKMAGEFRAQFNEAMRESELEDLKNQVASLREAARSINPSNMIKTEILNSLENLDISPDAHSQPAGSSVDKKPSSYSSQEDNIQEHTNSGDMTTIHETSSDELSITENQKTEKSNASSPEKEFNHG